MRLFEHKGHCYTCTLMYSDCHYGSMRVYWVRTDNEKFDAKDFLRNVLGLAGAMPVNEWYQAERGWEYNTLPRYLVEYQDDTAGGHYEIVVYQNEY